MHCVPVIKRRNQERADRELKELQERERCNCPCCAKGNVSELKEEEDEG